jgi:hypothetical protein
MAVQAETRNHSSKQVGDDKQACRQVMPSRQAMPYNNQVGTMHEKVRINLVHDGLAAGTVLYDHPLEYLLVRKYRKRPP